MKNVLVTSSYFKDAPYILIENAKDLSEYGNALEQGLEESIHAFMNSNIPIDRLDHYVNPENIGDSILCASDIRCKALGGMNPLLESGHVLSQKITSIGNMLIKGEAVLVNPVGGYAPVSPDWKITPYTYDMKSETNYHIASEPSLMNLENDPTLEQRTKDYFKENELELSYVIRLRNHSKNDLVTIFKEFIVKGGSGAYVYTTGIDIKQMYDYSEAIIESKLSKVIFEFNCGMNNEHEDVIAYLKEHHIMVEVL